MPEALRQIQFHEIAFWAEDDHAAALDAFRRSAREILTQGHAFQRATLFGGEREDWLPVCEAAWAADNARRFFEMHFVPFRVSDREQPSGLFTGYYEPQVQGRRAADKRFCVPIYKKPEDLTSFARDESASVGFSYGRRLNGKPTAYFTRKEIEAGALSGRGLEICHLESWVDAFFIHVQGSARVTLPDGNMLRLSYAAKNGHAYSGIGAALLARGVGTPATMSMQFLRNWMADHPEQMRELLWSNDSFVFFREIQEENESLGAIGAAKVNLSPLRSLAVDRRHWIFGTPLFVETHAPPEAPGGAIPFQRLMIAQDTGSAIKGIVRGDIYWGWGDEAAMNAGHMKSPGKMVALLPKLVAQRLSL